MGRRGRRPHPDILTLREWEVLGLLRERLTNEQIAERLGISLDGAKYHVSEILSKLGVETREEAAVWEPTERRRWWQRLIALPAAAKIVGVAAVIAAAAGVGLLSWNGASEEIETEAGQSVAVAWQPPILPEPLTEPKLTGDQVLIRGGLVGKGEITTVDAQPSTLGAITRYQLGEERPPDLEFAGERRVETAWLVTMIGWFDDFAGALHSVPPPIPPGPTPVPHIACREVQVVLIDDKTRVNSQQLGGGFSVSQALPDGLCQRPDQLPRELALVLGARALADRFAPFLASPAPISAFLPREVRSERTTLAEATEILGPQDSPVAPRMSANDDEPVWLLRFRGPFSYSPQASRGGAASAVCTEIAVVVHAESGEPLLTSEKQWHDC
jgi:DNA-binding CsgD family transcriptional regulator